MTDADIADRAFTLAEMASDESVKMSILAGREGQFSQTEPLNDAPVTYLEETEAPVYVLTNAKRGIGRGAKRNTVTPDGEFGTVVLVTGRRTLCLIGQQDGDDVISVPHESVAEVEYSRGLRKHRLVLTTPQSAYHCWIHRKTEMDVLESTTEFITDRKAEDPETIEDEGSPSRVMYRGRPVEKSTQNGSEDDTETESAENGSESAEQTQPTENGSDDSEEFTVMYRGRPVDKD